MTLLPIALERRCGLIRRQISRLPLPLRLSAAGTSLSIGIASWAPHFPRRVAEQGQRKVGSREAFSSQVEPQGQGRWISSDSVSTPAPVFPDRSPQKNGSVVLSGASSRTRNDLVSAAQLGGDLTGWSNGNSGEKTFGTAIADARQLAFQAMNHRGSWWPLWLLSRHAVSNFMPSGVTERMLRRGCSTTAPILQSEQECGGRHAPATVAVGADPWSSSDAASRCFRLQWPIWFASAVVPGAVATAAAKNLVDDLFNDPENQLSFQSFIWGPNDRLPDKARWGRRIPIPNPFSHDGRWMLRDLLIGTNILVFLAWQVLARSPRGVSFFVRHFVGSPENLAAGRVHSTLLSGFSHMTLGHLLANCFGLYVLLSPQCLGGLLTDKEGLGVFCAANVVATLVQIFYSRQIVLGSSGGVMAFVVLEAALQPLEKFVLLFPIPGLTLSSVQVAQLAVLCNIAGVFWAAYGRSFLGGSFGRASQVAWMGHLAGMLVGYLYSRAAYPRAFSASSSPSSFAKSSQVTRSAPFSQWLATDAWAQVADDWFFSTRDTVDSWRLKALQQQQRSVNDPVHWAELRYRIEALERMRKQRAIQYQQRRFERRPPRC